MLPRARPRNQGTTRPRSAKRQRLRPSPHTRGERWTSSRSVAAAWRGDKGEKGRFAAPARAHPQPRHPLGQIPPHPGGDRLPAARAQQPAPSHGAQRLAGGHLQDGGRLLAQIRRGIVVAHLFQFLNLLRPQDDNQRGGHDILLADSLLFVAASF